MERVLLHDGTKRVGKLAVGRSSSIESVGSVQLWGLKDLPEPTNREDNAVFALGQDTERRAKIVDQSSKELLGGSCDQRGFVLEVIEERALRNACSTGDEGRGRARIPLLDQKVDRGIEQRLARACAPTSPITAA